MSSNLRLGATVDAEASVTPNASANADGADEDGVTMPGTINVGSSVTIPVSVFNNNTAGRFLQAWIDFDNNGTFNDSDIASGGERLYSATTPANASAQTVNVTFTAPLGSSAGTQRGVRFRLSDSATTPTASGVTGEIEDYIVTIAAPACNITINPAGINDAFVGSSYSQGANFSATGAIGSVTWQMIPQAPAGIAAQWPGENSGRDIVAARNATAMDGAVHAAGKIGQAFSYDGVNDFHEAPYNAAFNPSIFTVEAWVRSTGGGDYRGIISSRDGTTYRGYILYVAPSGQLEFWLGTGSGWSIATGPVISSNTWTHVAGTYDGTTARFYVNGTLAGSTTTTFLANTTMPLRIGACANEGLAGQFFFTGQVDEPSIYNRALSAAEITARYNATNNITTLLPTGLTFNAATPNITGTPTGTPGTYPFAIRAVDSLGCFGLQNYTLTLLAPDYGDYSSFASASQTPDAAIRVGTLATDGEASNPANSTATGDDLVGDDEDLTMPAFTVGSTTTLAVPMTITAASLSGSTARVNVFVDWNGDNDVLDINETLTAQTVSASGNFNFSLTPPAGTTVGTKFLRIRATEGATAPLFSGTSALKGEVEDYAVTVAAGVLSIGNLVWIDADSDGVRDATETGEPGVTVQLWTPGANATEENGAGDDVKVGSDLVTDLNGNYIFSGLAAGTYYVRLPTPPADFPLTSGVPDTFRHRHGHPQSDHHADSWGGARGRRGWR
jgi:hypothetical protein